MLKNISKKERKEYVSKAKEFEKNANNFYKTGEENEEMAENYELAGDNYLKARKPQEAISCYRNAAKKWRELGENENEQRDLKNLRRLEKVLIGRWGSNLSGKRDENGKTWVVVPLEDGSEEYVRASIHTQKQKDYVASARDRKER